MSLLNLEIGLALAVAFLAGLGVILATGIGRARPRGRWPGRLLLLAGAVALSWLVCDCVRSNGPAIQDRLENAASMAVQAAIPGVRTAADGRDLVLSGLVASEDLRARAGELALGVAGVRTVDNRITVEAPAPRVPPLPSPQERLDRILRDQPIEFETGREVLLPSSLPVLAEVLSVLNESPQLSVRIEGHTDDAGEAASNRELSLRRARAVADWLSARGVADQRMESVGIGPDRPIASNATAAGRARNRRVEILVR